MDKTYKPINKQAAIVTSPAPWWAQPLPSKSKKEYRFPTYTKEAKININFYSPMPKCKGMQLTNMQNIRFISDQNKVCVITGYARSKDKHTYKTGKIRSNNERNKNVSYGSIEKSKRPTTIKRLHFWWILSENIHYEMRGDRIRKQQRSYCPIIKRN